MDKRKGWTSRHAQEITWLLVCAGWVVSAFLAYHLGTRTTEREHAQKVFEEVAVLIESGDSLLAEIDASLQKGQPSEERANLWEEYRALNRTYDANATRLLFLLDKYFGKQICMYVMGTLEGLYDLSDDYEVESESSGVVSRSIVSYSENWSGVLFDDPAGLREGFKWKMMEKCGIDTTPYLDELRGGATLYERYAE